MFGRKYLPAKVKKTPKRKRSKFLRGGRGTTPPRRGEFAPSKGAAGSQCSQFAERALPAAELRPRIAAFTAKTNEEIKGEGEPCSELPAPRPGRGIKLKPGLVKLGLGWEASWSPSLSAKPGASLQPQSCFVGLGFR